MMMAFDEFSISSVIVAVQKESLSKGAFKSEVKGSNGSKGGVFQDLKKI